MPWAAAAAAQAPPPAAAAVVTTAAPPSLPPQQQQQQDPQRNAASGVAAFLFRRDLRLADNRGLLAVRKAYPSHRILPLFFFNPAQIFPRENAYFGAACVEFMLQSLADLTTQLDGRLVMLEGTDAACLETVATAYRLEVVGYNRDITPFAVQRDAALELWCKGRNIRTTSVDDDYNLLPFGSSVNAGGGRPPFTVYTQFYNKVMRDHFQDIPRVAAPAPTNNRLDGFVTDGAARVAGAIPTSKLVELYLPSGPNPRLAFAGGRSEGLVRLGAVPSFVAYKAERDFIGLDRTTKLSPYLKFGCVSIREVFWAAVDSQGAASHLVKEVLWREFFAYVLYHHPSVVCGQVDRKAPNIPLQAKYAPFPWKWRPEHWDAFKQGNVGVPLVDAAVRHFTATGWSHNRCRMVMASFAIKVLGVDWRVCEQWYATNAIDYDVAANSGNWQSSSGQGSDAASYFRVFNPFLQSLKFDTDCTFIKRWVPQLASVAAADIHKWDAMHRKYPQVVATGYPAGPIVPMAEMTKEIMRTFEEFDQVTLHKNSRPRGE